MTIMLKEPEIRQELLQTTQAEPFRMLAATQLAVLLTQPNQQLPPLVTKQTQLARQLGELDAEQKTKHGGQLIQHLTRLDRAPDMLQTEVLRALSGLKIELRTLVSMPAGPQPRLKTI